MEGDGLSSSMILYFSSPSSINSRRPDVWFRLSLSIRLPDDGLTNQRLISVGHKTRQRTQQIHTGLYL